MVAEPLLQFTATCTTLPDGPHPIARRQQSLTPRHVARCVLCAPSATYTLRPQRRECFLNRPLKRLTRCFSQANRLFPKPTKAASLGPLKNTLKDTLIVTRSVRPSQSSVHKRRESVLRPLVAPLTALSPTSLWLHAECRLLYSLHEMPQVAQIVTPSRHCTVRFRSM